VAQLHPFYGIAVIQQLEKSLDFSVTTAQQLSSTSMPCRGSSRYLHSGGVCAQLQLSSIRRIWMTSTMFVFEISL
jgi:hypothetical protein